MLVEKISNDVVLISPTLFEYEIDYSGNIFKNSIQISLDDFINDTGIVIDTLLTLRCIVFQGLKWPPVYWKYLRAISLTPIKPGPENTILTLSEPVESLEYKGYYLIPFYSNYLIDKFGNVLNRLTNTIITASKANTGYYTFRMLNDDGSTENRLRHRIISLSFLPYTTNPEDLDVNHKNGIKGDDVIDNLEWCTRSENMNHAYKLGLRNDNIEVEVYDTHNSRHYIFASCGECARHLGITTATVTNRLKSNGYISYNGFQFRRYGTNVPWPEAKPHQEGSFKVVKPNGTEIRCHAAEAARLCGVTRTSLLRLIREGRNKGNNENIVIKLNNT